MLKYNTYTDGNIYTAALPELLHSAISIILVRRNHPLETMLKLPPPLLIRNIPNRSLLVLPPLGLFSTRKFFILAAQPTLRKVDHDNAGSVRLDDKVFESGVFVQYAHVGVGFVYAHAGGDEGVHVGG